MIPREFDGKIVIPKSNGFEFTSDENDNENDFKVWFYRREENILSLKEFLESITPENMGWDQPTRQLFYRSSSGKIYKMDFIEIK